MGPIRSLLSILVVLVAACPTPAPTPGPGPVTTPDPGPGSDPGPGPAQRCQVSQGAWTVPPETDVYTLAVREPARVFAVQSDRQLFMTEVGRDDTLPHTVTIPVRTLREGVRDPVYVVVVRPPWPDDGKPIWSGPIGQCARCEPVDRPCCPTPVGCR